MNANATSFSIATDIADYIAHGWKLCAIESGTKGPRRKNWNLASNALKAPPAPGTGVGLMHAFSKTACLDFDDLERATAWLAEKGIDAQALLEAPDAVKIVSGRPNRAKLLYRLDKPLRSFKLADGALELRCATSTGKSLQDVLPPTVHMKTGKPYTWEYGDLADGNWRNLPPLPDAVRTLWESLIARPEQPAEHTATQLDPEDEAAINNLREKLTHRDPDCGYEEWLRVGMALHHGASGSLQGLDLWNEFSARGSKYPGREKLAAHYASFKLDGDYRKITVAYLNGPGAEADLSQMEDLSAIGATLDAEAAEEARAHPTLPPENGRCTDRSNAKRIEKRFGKDLMSCGGQFYEWTGTHWDGRRANATAKRYAVQLADLVRVEFALAEKRAKKAYDAIPPEQRKAAEEDPRKNPLGKTEAGREWLKFEAVARELGKHINTCEMVYTQRAALEQLQLGTDVDPALLDNDPWALNCANGTVDLRTGELRPHRQSDYTTKCCPVDYRKEAKAPTFEKFILDIMGGDAAKAAFLRRWFGYSCTGDVSAQKLACHIGRGANGKSTLLAALQDVMQGYAGMAAPGLLMVTRGERHPTELADLQGKRLVTASETSADGELNEALVKQATGGDKIKARRMREDFWEFSPSHKLQLLSNYKPTIKGSDYAIWRRVLLILYPVRYGPERDVAAGRADRRRDDMLPAKLNAEREGILAWLVAGAVEWYGNVKAGSDDPLQVPDAMVDDTARYQAEQDRVGQFVRAECERGPAFWAPWTGIDGLYPAYGEWCRASGYHPLGKQRFINELEQCVPGFRKQTRKVGKKGEGRRSIEGALGIRLLAATDGADE